MKELISLTMDEVTSLINPILSLKEKNLIIEKSIIRNKENKIHRSSCVESIEFFPLYLQYGHLILTLNGRRYKYFNISKNRVTRLLNAPSQGVYFNKVIKNKFKFKRLKKPTSGAHC